MEEEKGLREEGTYKISMKVGYSRECDFSVEPGHLLRKKESAIDVYCRDFRIQ